VKGKAVVLVLAGAFLFGMTAYGHHSFASTYDLSQQVKIEGKLVQFLFRNPHSFVHVEAKDQNGEVQRWAIEWAGGAQLAGNPTRTPGEHRMRMVTFKRTSDGLSWGGRQGETVN
jgi:hypothetical protein